MSAPEPLPVELLATDDERRPAPFPDSARAECLKIIARLEGPGGVAAFLRTHQDDLEGATGAELLQSDPAGLLARLKRLEIEKSLEEIDLELDEEIVVDPYEPRLPRRAEKDVARVLTLLDELQPGRTSY